MITTDAFRFSVKESISNGRCWKKQQPPEPDLHPELLRGKKVVIGIGNPYMKDDGVAISVTRELRNRNLSKDVFVYDYFSMDLSMLSFFRNASKVVVVDALKQGSSPGTVSKYSISQEESPLLKLPNLDELQLFDLMDLQITMSSFLIRQLSLELNQRTVARVKA